MMMMISHPRLVIDYRTGRRRRMNKEERGGGGGGLAVKSSSTQYVREGVFIGK